MQPHTWLDLLHEIADAADQTALRYFRASDLRVETKPDRSLVSEADRSIEESVRRLAHERHPEIGILGEELGESGPSGGTRLIVDPIDATANFVRGVSIFATLLAIEQDGEIVAGLVSAPALHGRWTAARGSGAFEGKRPLRVSGVEALEHAQLLHGSVGGVEAQRTPPGLLTLANATWRQRGLGDFWQHCMVAEGAGEIAVDPLMSPWDIAPLLVLIEEAGGRGTSLAGERSIYAGSLVSSNGLLHERALEILNS